MWPTMTGQPPAMQVTENLALSLPQLSCREPSASEASLLSDDETTAETLTKKRAWCRWASMCCGLPLCQ